MANERVLRKIARQDAPPAGPDPAVPEPADTTAPRGHLPAAGHSKRTLNFRDSLWLGEGGGPGLQQLAEDAGVPAVCILEALVQRYLTQPQHRRRINAEALEVARDRKVTARRARREP